MVVSDIFLNFHPETWGNDASNLTVFPYFSDGWDFIPTNM